MNLTNISDSGSYVAEKFSNGFNMFLGGPGSEGDFASECIKLGHRIAMEGKDIDGVYTARGISNSSYNPEISVRVKVKHRLKTPSI